MSFKFVNLYRQIKRKQKNSNFSLNGRERKVDSELPCLYLVSKRKWKVLKKNILFLVLYDKPFSFFSCCFLDVVLSALDNMGFVANMVSLVLYFYGVMHFDLSSSANTLTNFMGSTFLLSLVGGFISDTYLNRFTTCLLFGSLEVLVSSKLYNKYNNIFETTCYCDFVEVS